MKSQMIILTLHSFYVKIINGDFIRLSNSITSQLGITIFTTNAIIIYTCMLYVNVNTYQSEHVYVMAIQTIIMDLSGALNPRMSTFFQTIECASVNIRNTI